MKLGLIWADPARIPETLIDKAQQRGIEIVSLDISDLSLITQMGKTRIHTAQSPLEDLDAALLFLPKKFMLFIEPLLDELAERGVYCPIKPTSFNLLANRPFTYTVLHSKSIPVPPMTIHSGKSEISLPQITYPIRAELYVGFNRTHSIIFESEASIKSYFKGADTQYDVIVLMHHVPGHREESLIIGDEVHTVRYPWNERTQENSANPISIKMGDAHASLARNAARSLGIDICTITTSHGQVLDASTLINIDRYERALGVDISGRIIEHIARKIS